MPRKPPDASATLPGAAEELRLERLLRLTAHGGRDRTHEILPRREQLGGRPLREPLVEELVARALLVQAGLRRRGQRGASLLGVDAPVRPRHHDEGDQGERSHRVAADVQGSKPLEHRVVGDAVGRRERLLLPFGAPDLPQALPQRLVLPRENASSKDLPGSPRP